MAVTPISSDMYEICKWMEVDIKACANFKSAFTQFNEF